MEDQTKDKQTLQKIWSVTTDVLSVLLLIFAIMLVGIRLVGFQPYTILSGSMSPQYKVGDMIYIRSVSPESIEEGDVISFKIGDTQTVVTHRVVAVNREERTFTTKGDANNTVDGQPVRYENVLGVVKFSIPKIGYVSVFLYEKKGLLLGLAVIATVIVLVRALWSVFRSL